MPSVFDILLYRIMRTGLLICIRSMLIVPLVFASCDRPRNAPQPAASSPATIRNTSREYRELFFKYPQIRSSDSTTIAWVVEHSCDEFKPFLEAYYEHTTARWRRANQIQFLVVDDEGNQVNGVVVSIIGIELPGDRKQEPIARNTTREFDGMLTLPWPRSSLAVELQLHKTGYRKARVSFVDYDVRAKSEILYESLTDLTWGVKLAPATPDGPVRILLRREVSWDPPVDDDGLLAASQDGDSIPKKVSTDAVLVIDSSKDSMCVIPFTGTYLVADKDGKIVHYCRAFKDDVLGFTDMEREGRSSKYIEFVHSALRSTRDLAVEDGPYQLYLYREAKTVNGVYDSHGVGAR